MESLHLRINKAFNRIMNELDEVIEKYEEEVKKLEVYDKIALLKYIQKQFNEVGIHKLIWMYHKDDPLLIPLKNPNRNSDPLLEADKSFREHLIKLESDLMAIHDKLPSEIKFWEDIYRQEINISNRQLSVGDIPPEITIIDNENNIKKIIRVLFDAFNKKFIHCSLEIFERHFFNNGTTFNKLRWLGTEPQIILFWEAMKSASFIDNEIDIPDLIVRHFINKKGEQFKIKQLRVVQNKTGYKNYNSPNLNFISRVIEKLKFELTSD